MMGGIFAGHNEGGGDIITKWFANNEAYKLENGVFMPFYQEKKFVQFYGMSPRNDKHFVSKEYRSSEGREVLVPTEEQWKTYSRYPWWFASFLPMLEQESPKI